MRERQFSVVIDAEPEQVWRTYVDPRRVPEWQTGKPVIVDVRGDGARPGSTYVSRRGRFAARTTVLAAERPRRIVTGTEAYLGLRLRVSSTLSALPGGTRLDLRVQTRWPPGLRLVGRLVERAILDPREGGKELRNLKALVEREAGS